MKNPIKWVEIPVNDMDRAEKFYTEYLGCTMSRQPDKEDGMQTSWFEMGQDEYGASGMLVKGERFTPSFEGSLLFFTAPFGGVTESLKRAEEMGIRVLVPSHSLGERGFFGVVVDSEGNRVAIHSMEE